MLGISERSKYSINPIEETNSAVKLLELSGKKITKLNIGDPAKYFRTPQYIIDAYISALKDGKTSYTTAGGLYPLREAVAAEYKESGANADDVIITSGVSEGLMFLNSIVINEGDSAMVMRPYYSMYNSFLQTMGGIPVDMNLDEQNGWKLDIEGASKAAHSSKRLKYMIIANPNNPTGTVFGRNDLSELVDIANDNDIVIVSDEIYDHLVFKGQKFTSLADVAKGTPHIILNGASKALAATGFRIGYALIPEHDKASDAIREKFIEYSTMRLSANTPAQYAVLSGLTERSERERFVKHMVKEVEDRCDYASKLINESKYMKVVPPKGAFYLFPKVDFKSLSIKDDKELVDLLLKRELILLSRGSGFGAASHIRIVGLPEKEILGDAISRIDAFLGKNRRAR
jgi:aspartate/methionine/tyrosine aminotransferase